MTTRSASQELAIQELDAISGGLMNVPRPDFHLQNGVLGSIAQKPNDAGFAGAAFYAFALVAFALGA